MSEEYRKAGVDLDEIATLGGRIKKISQRTLTPWALSGVGGFSGLLGLKEIKEHLQDFEDPIFTFTIDGVGTKTKIARMMSPSRIGSCGEDIVNHCINDTIPSGARPIAFLNYIAQDKIRPDEVAAVLEGMARACSRANIPLLGGETAQMQGVYRKGELDIVGFMVGIVDRKDIIDGSAIRPCDCLIGLASNGLHTNGYSLVRKIFSKEGWPGFEKYWPYFYYKEIGAQLADVLLRPHTSYLEPVKMLQDEGINIRGIAHITGGGITGNLVRILPEGVKAKIEKSAWAIPPIFELIQKIGSIPEEDMFEVFNMGIGMILVVPPGQCNLATYRLEKGGYKAGYNTAPCEAYEIGRIQKRGGYRKNESMGRVYMDWRR